jgi:CDP-diacylglycerol---serine O-phosphatidyltransferase
MAQPLKSPNWFAGTRYRFALPNGITVLAMCFGLTGLTYANSGNFPAAIACVLIAALLDGCDGRVARATNSESRFGAELDSLADVICFGAVPAFVMFSWGLGTFGKAGWLACLVFAAASALRLARFNVAATGSSRPSWMSNYFTGVPTPGGAFLALTPIYIEQSGWVSSENAVLLALFSLPLVAVLMVSNLPTFSAKSLSRKAIRVMFLPSLMIAAVLIGGLLLIPWVVFTMCALIYLGSLPFSWASHQRRLQAAS